MRVTVLFFSVLRDLTGTDRLGWEVAAPASLGGLVAEIALRYPDLAGWDSRLLLAVNGEYAGRDTLLANGDEIALMPPVQGG